MGLLERIASIINSLFYGSSKYEDGNTNDLGLFNIDDILNSISNFPKSIPEEERDVLNGIHKQLKQACLFANKRELNISVVGDFSVGKSKFMNALLGINALPVSAKACTAIITRIKYGKNNCAIVKYQDRDVQMTYEEYVTFSSYSISDLEEAETKGTISRFEGIIDATVYVNNDFLRDTHVSFIDTIGLGARKEDTAVTVEQIRNSIATIYICSERGLSEPDVDFIQKYLAGNSDNIFYCINRVDRIKDRKEIENVKNLTVDRLRSICAHNNPVVYTMSSYYESINKGLEEVDEEKPIHFDYSKHSGFREFENGLISYLNNDVIVARKKYLISRIITGQDTIASLISRRVNYYNSEIDVKTNQLHILNKQIEQLKSKIKIIQSKFKNTEEQIYKLVPPIYFDVLTSISAKWEKDVLPLRRRFNFSYYDYKRICGVKMNIFLSDEEKREKIYEILNSISAILADYIIKEFSVRLTYFRAEAEEVVLKLFKAEHYRKDSRISLQSITPSFDFYDKLNKYISDAIWTHLTKDGVSLITLLGWALGINNDSKVITMLTVSKDFALKEFHSDFLVLSGRIKSLTKTSIDKLYATVIENDSNHIIEMEKGVITLKDEMVALTKKKESEESYFKNIKKSILKINSEIQSIN